jgi:hypothetical protein
MRHLIGFVLASAAATSGGPAFAAMPLSPCDACRDAQKEVRASGLRASAGVHAGFGLRQASGQGGRA